MVAVRLDTKQKDIHLNSICGWYKDFIGILFKLRNLSFEIVQGFPILFDYATIIRIQTYRYFYALFKSLPSVQLIDSYYY
jgi:hypothetical protein